MYGIFFTTETAFTRAGALVGTVLYRKETGGKKYIVADAGMTELLRPSHYNAFHRIEAVRERPATITADVVGPVCESGDFLALDREIGRLPGIKQEAARLSLDVEIQRRVYTLLNAQLEEARLEGSRTISTISVLDPARAPTLRSRPRRMVIVGITAGIALVAVLAWAMRRARRELEAAGLLTP